ncbi:MAG: hypothetical protein K0Q85_44 [Caproiciproducens sp.]|jgi:hypothetical protein|nr:hypothetical protein [Caproiciproducens sp.]
MDLYIMATWVFIAVGIVCALLVKYILPVFATRIVDNHFNEKLETHKHELHNLTEAAKFDFQRMLSGFNLYAPKRHDAYEKMHSSIIKAKNYIFGLRLARTEPTFSDYDESDVQEYLKDILILPNGKIKEVVNLWESGDQESAKKEIRRYLKIKANRDASNSFIDANQCFFDSSLYLSNGAIELAQLLLNDLRSLLINYNSDYPDKELREESNQLKINIEKNIEELTLIMKMELSVGYYEEK